jgi:hypothetical protein
MEMIMPPIPIEELKPETRDYLLSEAMRRECSPTDVLRAVLDASARRAGFTPQKEEEK